MGEIPSKPFEQKLVWQCNPLRRVKVYFSLLVSGHWIYFVMSAFHRPPLWPSGQSSWLQIRRPGFDSRHYQKKKVVGLERGPLSLVSTTEELLDRKSRGSCLENREYCRRDPSRWPRGNLHPQKLAITSPTSGGRSVGVVRSRTQTMEFPFFLWVHFVACCMNCFVGTYCTSLAASYLLR
jgi:hypothetical protein